MQKHSFDLSRRRFFKTTASIGAGAASLAAFSAAPAAADTTMDGMDVIENGSTRLDAVPAREPDFRYEIVRSDAEWEDQLTEEEFKILRLGFTEIPKSSPLWQETRSGVYRCKGCGLLNYVSERKVILDKGWAFFHHAEPNAVLTGIDTHQPFGSKDVVLMMEAHCRRCGSHLGHIVSINNKVLHCINGASLTFTPA